MLQRKRIDHSDSHLLREKIRSSKPPPPLPLPSLPVPIGGAVAVGVVGGTVVLVPAVTLTVIHIAACIELDQLYYSNVHFQAMYCFIFPTHKNRFTI